jgi:uncharacterized short protein YbdD (DUF466 family)
MWTDRGRRTDAQTLGWATLLSVRASVDRFLSALFGMPDYARYVEHQAKCHAGGTTMSEKEFVRAELERKYAGGGGRCC